MHSKIDFGGKNVLITGASSGIGASLAKEFASKGAGLILLGRNTKRLEEVAASCSGAAYTKVFVADMSSESSIDSFVEEFSRTGISLDVMVLNAGISQRAKCFDTDFEVDRKVMETDFFGPVYLTKKLSSHLISHKDFRLAVTSSISGLFGFPLRSAYCAAKHALFGFFETIGIEYPNIKVTFLIPGRINTPISMSAVSGDGSSHTEMDPGQASGMSSQKCAEIALKAIAKGKRRKLIGGTELLMVYIKKYCPCLFFKIAGKISAV